jgi:putative ABC transport system permease protein
MLLEYFRIAIRSIGRRKLRAWLTMIGIFIGIAAVVSLISLGQGMQKAIEEQFFQLGADKVSVSTKGVSTGPPGSNSDVQLLESDLSVIQRVNGVEVATGRIVEPITVEFNDKERFLYMASLPEEQDERKVVLSVANVDDGDMLYGRSLKTSDQYRVIMSEDYYNNEKFDGKALSVGDKILINGKQVDIVGFYKKTGNPFVDMSFVMNEEPMRDLLDIPEKNGLIIAKVSDGASIPLVAAAIEKDLRKHRNVKEGDEDFEVQTSEETLDTFKTVLNIVTAVLVGIAAISLLVGGIGIMNTMYTAVLERHREIGIMKAIGARNNDILTLFLIESGLLGVVGGAIGIILGIGFSKIVEVAAEASLGTSLIKAYFPWYLILGALLFSFLIGSIAGTYPAWQASKLQPVEALRS